MKQQQASDLDQRPLTAIPEAIADALDGEPLPMQQFSERVVRQVGSWAGEPAAPAWGGAWPRWRLALGAATLAGVLCYGPPQGNPVTFGRPDRWLGDGAGQPAADPGAALVEVFRRYLWAYGPATARDFAQWFYLPPRTTRDLVTSLGKELPEVDVEGYRSYWLVEDIDQADDSEAGALREQLPVRLLPHFDCYVIGCRPRDRLLPVAWAE